eukprot:16340625-Heterocapsa_arctica.AAC.1
MHARQRVHGWRHRVSDTVCFDGLPLDQESALPGRNDQVRVGPAKAWRVDARGLDLGSRGERAMRSCA